MPSSNGVQKVDTVVPMPLSPVAVDEGRELSWHPDGWYSDGHDDCVRTSDEVNDLQKQLNAALNELDEEKRKLISLLEECIQTENDLDVVLAQCEAQEKLIAELEARINDPAALEKLQYISKLEVAVEGAKRKVSMMSTGQDKAYADMQATTTAVLQAKQRQDNLATTASALNLMIARAENDAQKFYVSTKESYSVSCLEDTCTSGTVNCFADPCSLAKCGPGKSCVSDYCGGCNAVCVPVFMNYK